MRRTHRRAYGPLIACIASVALLPVGTVARAQERTAQYVSEKLRVIGRVSSRLLGKFVSETWSDYFDAVVVIRQEVAPTFDPWK